MPYKPKPCKVCGKLFTPTGPKAKWCDKCRGEAIRTRNREYKRMTAKPNNNAVYTCDSLEDVAKCLSCTRPFCRGQCAAVMDSSDRAKNRYKAKMEESMRQIAHYVRAGARDEFIMRELGITKAQLASRKRYARAEGFL